MPKINFKDILINSLIILIIFLADRISKYYILNLAELENTVDIYLTPYLNFYLIWNKGIAFGLFSFDEKNYYNYMSILIVIITIIVFFLMIRSKGKEKIGFSMIVGGSLGNLFDRLVYSSVPDFIDIHINNYHWFIFNVADIFITIGVMLLIYSEIYLKEKA